MSIQLRGPFLDVAHCQSFQLSEVITTSCVQRKQNRPHDTAAENADVSKNLEIAEKEEGVQGAMVEDIGIGDLEEGLQPVEIS